MMLHLIEKFTWRPSDDVAAGCVHASEPQLNPVYHLGLSPDLVSTSYACRAEWISMFSSLEGVQKTKGTIFSLHLRASLCQFLDENEGEVRAVGHAVLSCCWSNSGTIFLRERRSQAGTRHTNTSGLFTVSCR